MAPIGFSSFLGAWRDSLGNEVRAQAGAGGVQATLAKPGGDKEVALVVRRVGSSFQCGHFELDEAQSSALRLVWRDKRWHERLTVWERVDLARVPLGPAAEAPPVPGLWPATAAPPPAAASAAGAAAAVSGGAPEPHAAASSPWSPVSSPGVWDVWTPPSLAAAAPDSGAGSSGQLPPRTANVGAGAPAQAMGATDLSPVLRVLSVTGVAPGSEGGSDATKGASQSSTEEARWADVLRLLAASPPCPGDALPGLGASNADRAAKGQRINQLSSPFGLPEPTAPPAEASTSEELRERVLHDTLTQLLQEKIDKQNACQATGSTACPGADVEAKGGAGAASWQGTPVDFAAAWMDGLAPKVEPQYSATGDDSTTVADARFADMDGADAKVEQEEQFLPDWKRYTGAPRQRVMGLRPKLLRPSCVQQEVPPLDKFIRFFGLDRLAAECLKKLQDDEAAYVIESCQHRLKWAPNPSAVVMIAIRGVAARVGRRYWGSPATNDFQSLLAAAGLGGASESTADEAKGQELRFFMGSPSANSPSPERARAPTAGEPAGAAVESAEALGAATTRGEAPVREATAQAAAEVLEVLDDEEDLAAGAAARPPPAKRFRSDAGRALDAGASPQSPQGSPQDEPEDSFFFMDTGSDSV